MNIVVIQSYNQLIQIKSNLYKNTVFYCYSKLQIKSAEFQLRHSADFIR